MTTHVLKTWPEYFEAVRSGRKRFEYRRDDRGFAEGDVLVLREYNPETGLYSGRKLFLAVTYVLRGDFVPQGWAILSVAETAGV